MSVVIGCLRRLQQWSLTAIFDEHRRFATAGSSLLDLQCIELFEPDAPAQQQPDAAPATEAAAEAAAAVT